MLLLCCSACLKAVGEDGDGVIWKEDLNMRTRAMVSSSKNETAARFLGVLLTGENCSSTGTAFCFFLTGQGVEGRGVLDDR